MSIQSNTYALGRFDHLDFAAFLAIWLRFLGDSLSALTLPPFSPPRRPKATAAGFLLWGFGLVGALAGSVAASTTCAAIMFMSVGFLDRLGMPQYGMPTFPLSAPPIQTDPLPGRSVRTVGAGDERRTAGYPLLFKCDGCNAIMRQRLSPTGVILLAAAPHKKRVGSAQRQPLSS